MIMLMTMVMLLVITHKAIEGDDNYDDISDVNVSKFETKLHLIMS